MKRLQYLAIPACAALALLIGTWAQGQDFDDDGNTGFNDGLVTDVTGVFSRVRIIEVDDRVMRLDTNTGELSRFRGTLSGSNARGNFVTFAQPLSDPTSGFLEIQEVGDAIFLVDVSTGQTWILRQRSNNVASWIEVE